MAVEASTPLGSGRAATAVTGAIRSAAAATGTSFNYLLATAKIESGLDPGMTMKSSSAAGLFQFIDQTWLGTLKQAGPAFGYGDYANAISRNASGRYSVADPEMRKEIMKLRNDPTANSVMAGVLTQQNAAALKRRIGRDPSDSELYIAHFFGAGGASKLIQLAGSNPQATAADAFPQAAQANRTIFYDRQGNARSVSGVYAELTRRFKTVSVGPGAAMASASGRPARVPAATDVAAVTKVFAVAQGPAVSAPGTTPSTASPIAVSATGPIFNSLFRDQDRRTALDPMVVALWSAPANVAQPDGATTATQPAPAQSAPAQPAPNAPVDSGFGSSGFDLFQDMRPNTRGLFGGS
jgi:hypothetical protein